GKKNEQIAAAIVLRGLAKDGKFANTSDGGGDGDGKVKAAVKSAVESGVQKTMSSVSNLVKQSILLQLGKVSKAVQDTNAKATSGSGAPKSKSASQNEGGGGPDGGPSTAAQK
uniref:variable large family protein n=1 Tax=Borreliella garinii TaxID=29519 RepID=UPI001AEF6ED0